MKEATNMIRALGKAVITKGLVKRYDTTELFVGIAAYNHFNMKGYDAQLDQAYDMVFGMFKEVLCHEISF